MNELEAQCDSLIRDAEKCAKVLLENPGISGPDQVIDLYLAIARLARLVRHANGLALIPARQPVRSEAQAWDAQIERDDAAGKLDARSDRARENLKTERVREI